MAKFFDRLFQRGSDRLIWLRVRAPSCAAAETWRREVLEAAPLRDLRKRFLEIDISRDERPELDAAAQSVLQSLGERSGWPLQLFLDPGSGAPVFGCTSPDLVSCERILRHLLVARESSPGELTSQAEEARQAARARDPLCRQWPRVSSAEAREILSGASLASFLTPLNQSLDPLTGGLGPTADAFLYPQAYEVLLRRPETLRVGQAALERLARSESCDVLGGGFFRSTDGSKLLGENAEMLELLDLAAKITRAPFLTLTAAEARAGLLRDFWHASGGFAAGLSEAEGYYEWNAADFLGSLEGPERLPAQRFFGLTREVSFGGDRRPRLVTDIATLATELGLPPADLQNQLATIRRKLLAFRATRSLKQPLRAPSAALPTALALRALLAPGLLEDGSLEASLLLSLETLVEEFSDRSRTTIGGRDFSAGNRLRWQLARACLAAALLKRPPAEQSLHEKLWVARADGLLGDVTDVEGGVRGDTVFLGDRSDLADFTGRSSAALRMEAWLDRFELANRRQDFARVARLEAELPNQVASAMTAARELGLAGAGVYASFVRAGACGLFRAFQEPHARA